MANNWLNTEEYPFAPRYFYVNGQRMHYVEEGQGETILFVHGTPSWSFDFRNQIKALSKNYRCIAIDHIGFGLSDKPEHYDYSTQNHSRTLEMFIEHKGLKNISLVVHDFGGPIALNVAIKNPDKFSRLVVLNSWLWSSQNEPEFVQFSKLLRSPLLPFLYKRLNLSPRILLPQSYGERKLSRRLLSQYTRPFASAKERGGPLAFAYSLLNDQNWFAGLWKQREKISNKPLLLIWGMKDKMVTEKYLHKFADHFHHVQVQRLETCGRFPQEEQSDTVTACLGIFMTQRVLQPHS